MRNQDLTQERYAFETECHSPILKAISLGRNVYTLDVDGTVNVIDLDSQLVKRV